jgi:hypothetical protein
MSMFARTLLSLTLNTVAISSFGQSGYIAIDKTILAGVEFFNSSDADLSRFIRVKIYNRSLKYSPGEVEEFGFNDRRFISKYVELEKDPSGRYFLEQLVDDTVSLYYAKIGGRKLLFLENENTLFKLNKKGQPGFYDQLLALCHSCKYAKSNATILRYNKLTVKNYLEENLVGCSKKRVPYISYDVSIGFNKNKLTAGGVPYNGKEDARISSQGVSIGISTNRPLGSSNFSLQPELWFGTSKYFFVNDFDPIGLYIALSTATLSVPVLTKFTIDVSNRVQPYLLLGINNRFHLVNDQKSYLTEMEGNDRVITDIWEFDDILPTYQFGIVGSAGVLVIITRKLGLNVAMRYGADLNGNNKDLIASNQFSFILGLSF